MHRVVWKREYETGVDKIDAEHKAFFALCRAMAEAVAAGKDEVVMGPVLTGLKLYTVEHFGTEEVELENQQSPLLPRMKAEHVRLAAKLAVVIDGFGKRSHAETLEDLLVWLDTEMVPHLTGIDMMAFLATPEGRKAHARRLYAVA